MAKKKKINKKKLLIIIGICILLVIVSIMIYLFIDNRSVKDIFKYLYVKGGKNKCLMEKMDIHIQTSKQDTYLTPYIKINSKLIKDLNLRAKL